MKLKGIFAKKLSKKDREKKEKTLSRMEKTRNKDSDYLRDIINKKLLWAEAERRKGLEEVKKINNQILRLEGIILFIRDLLNPKKKEDK